MSYLPWVPVLAVLPAHYVCILAAAHVVPCGPIALLILDWKRWKQKLALTV